ncbi:MAG TPA: MFS transporter [Bacillales bacterium]
MAPKMTRKQKIGLILVISILFTDELLYSIIIPIIPYFTEQLQISPAMTGILFSSYAIAALVSTPFFGILADRAGRRVSILAGLAILLFATLMFAFSHSYWLLIASRFIQGIGAGAAWAASLALLADLFPPKMRGRAMGLALTGISTGTLLGAPIGGFIFEFVGYQWPFLFVAGLAAINFVLVLSLVPKAEKGSAPQQTEQTNMLSLLQNRSVLFILSVIFVVSTTLCLLDPTLPLFFTERFHISSADIGILFGVMTLANALVSPVSGFLSDRYRPGSIMLIGMAAIAVASSAIALSQTLWQSTAAMILAGLGIGFALSPAMSHLGNVTGEDGSQAHGQTYALSDMTFTAGMIMGPLIGGIITEVWSVSAALHLLALGLFLLVIVIFGVRRRKNAYKTPIIQEQQNGNRH